MNLLRQTEQPKVFVGDYTVGSQFDKGCFGDIYLGTSICTGEPVAIKLEKLNARDKQLAYEYEVYKELRPAPGLPEVYHYSEEEDFRAMVMELLGPSLNILFELCGRTFTMKTVLMLADEMVLRLELIHSRGFVHRDIKPDNFAVGRNLSCKRVHIIDFGLSKKFWDPITKVHLPYREDCALTGTARFASVNSHDGIEQSRRDDLISVGYMLIYFLHGKLPWQGITASTKRQKYERIHAMKLSISNTVLCKSVPTEFARYLDYCYQLRFDTVPDYNMLRRSFHHLSKNLLCKLNYIFDWDMVTIGYHRNQYNPAKGIRLLGWPVKFHRDNGSSGYPIVRNEKCNRWP